MLSNIHTLSLSLVHTHSLRTLLYCTHTYTLSSTHMSQTISLSHSHTHTNTTTNKYTLSSTHTVSDHLSLSHTHTHYNTQMHSLCITHTHIEHNQSTAYNEGKISHNISFMFFLYFCSVKSLTWSQSYQSFFLRKWRIFPFFAFKLDHF